MATETTPLLQNNQIRNGRLYLAAFSAVLGSFIFGYAMVFPSAAIPQLQIDDDPNLHMNVGQISWFGSVFAIGAIAGGLSAMVLNDKIGRKHSIMISVIPSTAGFFVMALAKGWLWLLLGRLFTGIAAGITASSIPVYVSEISHPGVRGFLGSSSQTMTVIGGLVLYALGLVLPWRWLAVAGEVPGLIMLFLLCFMPNSPRFLLTKDKDDEAKRALQWLRGPDTDYESEFQRIKHSVISQGGMRCSDFTKSFYLKPILISVFMRILQQMTGITPILIYMEPIFEKTAVSLEPKVDAAIVGFVRLFPVLIAACIMDKTGRKSLLHASAFIMYLSMMVLGVYTHKTPCNRNVTGEALSAKEPFGAMSGFELSSGTLIPLMSIIFTVLGYAVGWGPITWLLMSEILPVKVRGIVSGVCVVASYVTAFLLTQFFMQAVEAFGLYVPFLFFSAICVLNIIFTAKCVPETKGKTLEEIENYFRNGNTVTIAER
ncbi:solute carrier family 2, facilitated glucose transporter member 6-like isoform X2 [Silurus meridionalis]|uniref:solute carrier family 2, facilitated glucose transporter member 6-like isoform X2 n=1 Tax=Silurus meridionalis TaxID=175797 RepID=UPI001EEBF248|nr:solute carrier family 2, facilitated glucose transporter member 6-like isoform X2 [Silurus meridionalis]